MTSSDRLNVGCGPLPLPGWVNLDHKELEGVDVVHDLDGGPLPFDDKSFAEIACFHVLEHVGDLVSVMRELHRTLRLGGVLHIRSPHFTSHTTFIDPTHRRTFSLATFDFFVAGNSFSGLREYYCDFIFSSYIQRHLNFTASRKEPWNRAVERCVNRSPGRIDYYERTALSRLFPAAEIDLIVRR